VLNGEKIQNADLIGFRSTFIHVFMQILVKPSEREVIKMMCGITDKKSQF